MRCEYLCLVIPNHMKRNRTLLALSISLVGLLSLSCHKEEPHHNTTYIWGTHYWDEVWPADRVAASADSTLVDYVFLENNGETLSGLDVSRTRKNMENILNSVSPENRHKIRGAGNLRHLYITDKTDSTWLSQFGFVFVEPQYKH